MFVDPNKGTIDRFAGLMDTLCMAESIKELRIRFDSRTMVLTNVTTFVGVAVEATVLAVDVEDVCRYQRGEKSTEF